MKSESFWLAAWHLLGPMAIETCLIVGIAALAHRFIVSVQWRRTVWQICALSLATLVLCESTGLVQGAAEWIGARTPAAPSSLTVLPTWADLPQAEPIMRREINDEFRRKVASRMQKRDEDEQRQVRPEREDARDVSKAFEAGRPGDLPVTRFAEMESPPNAQTGVSAFQESQWAGFPAVAWLGLVWMVGTAVISARLCFSRFVFMLFHCRQASPCEEDLHERVRRLAKRLGIRRLVRVVELPRLAGPVAFGWFRPTIALPKSFALDFAPGQQDAMLVHELAHLAAGDPAWQGVADLVAAALWWHPLVWWSRRRLEAAAEASADEASLVVANGPNVLAECLVQLGGRLVQARPFGWLGIDGASYRSGLGRRVKQLMRLNGGSWNPPHRLKAFLSKSLGPVALTALAVLCTAWTSPALFQKGETMKTLHQSWKHFVATLALVSAINADAGSEPGAASDQGANAAGPTSAVPQPAAAPKAPVDTDTTQPPSSPPPAIDPRLLQRYGMNPLQGAPAKPTSTSPTAPSGSNKSEVLSKLDRIILQEVFYDGIPLKEVVKDLIDKARRLDPEKLGLNFLVSNSFVTGDAVDPVTGQPAPSTPTLVDLNSVSIRLNPPLRHVRMKDALDAITKVADRPIHFTVEDYGVVFASGSPPAQGASPSEQESSPLYRMDPRLLERYGLIRPGLTNPSSPSKTPQAAPRKNSKLETIVLSEVHFDGLPLSEVVKFLYDESRKLDPEKRGVNFIISNAHRSVFPVTPADPSLGRPLDGTVSRGEIGPPVDVNNVVVRLNPPLRNVRLKDVLDAMIKVSDQPLKYSAEDYGVVLSLDSSGPVAPQFGGGPFSYPTGLAQRYGPVPGSGSEVLEVRTFRVDTNTLVQGLESAFGITVGAAKASPPIDLEKQKIELRLAEAELQETQKKFEVGAAQREDVEKARGALELLRAANETERTKIRLLLAEQELQRVSRMAEVGKASTLEVERAKAAIELLLLDLKAVESGIGRPAAIRTSQTPSVQYALRQLFAQLGVTGMHDSGPASNASNYSDPGLVHSHPAKAIFYNDMTGIVMVRATAAEMKIVQAALETLGGAVNAEGRRTVSVLAGVANPKAIELRPSEKLSILEAIAEAGGFTKSANKNRIEVTRKGKQLTFKFEELKSTTEPDKIFWLEPGDVIVVNERFF